MLRLIVLFEYVLIKIIYLIYTYIYYITSVNCVVIFARVRRTRTSYKCTRNGLNVSTAVYLNEFQMFTPWRTWVLRMFLATCPAGSLVSPERNVLGNRQIIITIYVFFLN